MVTRLSRRTSDGTDQNLPRQHSLSEKEYEKAAKIFSAISRFNDAKEKELFCLEKIDSMKKDAVFEAAKSKMYGDNIKNFEDAVKLFETIPGWKDADVKVAECQRIIADIEEKEEAKRIERKRKAEIDRIKTAEIAKRNKKIAIIFTPIICLVIATIVLLNTVIIPNSKYNDAIALMDQEDYTEAITIFEALDGYKDSSNKIVECKTAIETAILDDKYNDAVALMKSQKYEEAIDIFNELDEYKDSENKITECTKTLNKMNYNNAQNLLKANKYAEAAIAFGKAGNYKDAKKQSKKLWDKVAVRETIVAYSSNSFGVKNNGTVVLEGNKNNRQNSITEWSDIVAISANLDCRVGLKNDGTVVTLDYYNNLSSMRDIVSISAGSQYLLCLKNDGTVEIVARVTESKTNPDVSSWKDIIAVSAGSSHAVGLKSDGTVTAASYFATRGEESVSEWSNIIAVSAGWYHTVGLKSDGTVVATGDNDKGQCDVSKWRDIMAISAGKDHTVGLKSDGTVVAVGDNNYGQCDVSDWDNIVAVSAGYGHTLGLKRDGTVVATEYKGSWYYGECNVSDWKNIKLPENIK